MHIEQDGGTISANDTQIRFSRNADGIYTKGAEYGPKMMKATYKYAQQGRYFLGVANVRLADGSISGVRCGVFNYSTNRIISIKDFAKAIKDKLARVKKLVCGKFTSPWSISNAPEGYNAVHKENHVTHLKRVGKGMT